MTTKAPTTYTPACDLAGFSVAALCGYGGVNLALSVVLGYLGTVAVTLLQIIIDPKNYNEFSAYYTKHGSPPPESSLKIISRNTAVFLMLMGATWWGGTQQQVLISIGLATAAAFAWWTLTRKKT